MRVASILHFFVLPLFLSQFAFSQSETVTGQSYFTINEKISPQQQEDSFENPMALIGELSQQVSDDFFAAQAANEINLIRWVKHATPPPAPSTPYDRAKHFGSWIQDPVDNRCMNVRAVVLERDSASPVEMRETNPCSVARGEWNDPYTGTTFTDSKDIQIDHVVPLKHTYISGGWKWNNEKRCAYTNFLSYKKHLLSVSAKQNESKSDKSPDRYLPPNEAYVCDYLKQWLVIKAAWKLFLFEKESQAILQEVKARGCERMMILPKDKLALLREHIANTPADCRD